MHRQMRYYIAVVETNSFFEAGELCHISQSAISQQIKALEEELQVQLLERHGRKFTVTPAGRYFYEQARKQVQALDSTLREVRRVASGEYQRLRVGVLNGFSAQGLHPEGAAVWLCIFVPVVIAYFIKMGRIDIYQNPYIYVLDEQGRPRRIKPESRTATARDTLSALLTPPLVALTLALVLFLVMGVYLTLSN